MLNSLKKKLVKKAVKWTLEDPKLARQTRFRLMETADALRRLKARGLQISCILDVGASDGRWSRGIESLWPDARFHLIEANTVHEPALRRLCARNGNYSFARAAAAEAVGEIYFDARDRHGGLASQQRRDGMISLPATSLAHEVDAQGLKPPYLIKLDTHGYEVPILKGAEPLFGDTAALVIEVYNFTQGPEALRFWEMCRHLEERGFRVIDITEPAWRPHDEAFWQADFVFLKADARQFGSESYSPLSRGADP